jgi:hypothetical protein
MSPETEGAVNIYPAVKRGQKLNSFIEKNGNVDWWGSFGIRGFSRGGARIFLKKIVPRMSHGIPFA